MGNELDFDYETLNEIFSKEKYGSIKFGRQIEDLAKLIIKNCKDSFYHENYAHKVSPNEAFDMALDFFLEINPTYAYQFQNIMNMRSIENGEEGLYEGDHIVSIKMASSTLSKRTGSVDNDGRIRLTLNGNIRDIFLIVHELMHKFSKPYQSKSLFRMYLAEGPSLAMEFVLYNLLKQKANFEQDNKSVIKQRIKGEVILAVANLIDCKLYDLYNKNGRLDAEILRNFQVQLANEVDYHLPFSTVISRIKVIIKKRALVQAAHVRHLIGFLIACDFYSKFKKDPSEIENIFKLNTIVGNSNATIEEDQSILKEIGFNIFKDLSAWEYSEDDFSQYGGVLSISSDMMKRYEESLKEVYDEFIEEQELANAVSHFDKI